MAEITWTEVLPSDFGIHKGVIYGKDYAQPWNGLVRVNSGIDGGGDTTAYYDGEKYKQAPNQETFSGSIEAFTYPRILEELDGYINGFYYHQLRKPFGMSYMTSTELHLVWNVFLSPSARLQKTTTDEDEGELFKWDFVTSAEAVPSARPTSHMIIPLGIEQYADPYTDLINELWGTEVNDARLPSPTEVVQIFETYAQFRIIDHGDGTWTAIGSEDRIKMLTIDKFEITSPTAIYVSDTTYTLSSD